MPGSCCRRRLGGLPQAQPDEPLVATYGTASAPGRCAVACDPQAAIQPSAPQIDSPGHPPIKGEFGTGSLITAPLLTGLIFADGDTGYVLLGSVTRGQIEAMALDLVATRRERSVSGPSHRATRDPTEGLTKRYGKITVVEDLALDVRPGDRYGFLGPNGSGKSTTVRMLLGLVFPSGGRIELLGQSVPKHVRSALARVGAIIEAPPSGRTCRAGATWCFVTRRARAAAGVTGSADRRGAGAGRHDRPSTSGR